MRPEEEISYFIDLVRKHYGERLAKVILFGSMARNEHTHDSDADLLLILRDEKVQIGQEARALSSFVTETAIEKNLWVSPKPLSMKKWLEGEGDFLSNIKKEGLVLYG